MTWTSIMHRAARLAAILGAGLLGASATAQPSAATPKLTALYADPGHPDLTGVWQVTGWFSFSSDKALPAFKPPYDAIYAKRMKAFDTGAPIDDVTADCLPPGMPHIQVVPYPFELMQTPGRVTMLFEYAGQVRRIYLDGGEPKDPDPTYYGTSVGRWEGDTLVVTTANIREDTQLDYSGVPHSDALTISERIGRIAPDALEDQITLTDPKAYSRPFTSTRVYKLHRDWTIGEYVCEENNRNKTGPGGVTGFGVAPPPGSGR